MKTSYTLLPLTAFFLSFIFPISAKKHHHKPTSAPTYQQLTCASIDCMYGYECDDILLTCVPVTCDAELACAPNEQCVTEEIYCIRAPCPQFHCEPKEGCLTTCGKFVPLGETYQDDGANFCNTCSCTKDGAVCTEIGCNADCDQAKCDDEQECVVCDQVYPECRKGCKNCEVVEQTCESCAYAVCHDDDCVYCIQVVPECKPGCKKCKIHPQTCKHCAWAQCKDHHLR